MSLGGVAGRVGVVRLCGSPARNEQRMMKKEGSPRDH